MNRRGMAFKAIARLKRAAVGGDRGASTIRAQRGLRMQRARGQRARRKRRAVRGVLPWEAAQQAKGLKTGGDGLRKKENRNFVAVAAAFFLALLACAAAAGGKGLFLTAKVTEVARLETGSGPDSVGVAAPPEGNPEGPMSFAIGRGEELYILDQLNRRVQVFRNGKRTRTVPIPGETFADLELTPDGKIVLLDNLVRKALFVLDPAGKVLNTFPLEGRLIPYAPSVTEIQIVAEGEHAGIWVLAEGKAVRVASLDGKPAERVAVPGKFAGDGRRLLGLRTLGDASVVVSRSAKDRFSQWDPERTLFLDKPILGADIWADRTGRIYVRTLLSDDSAAADLVSVLNPGGEDLGRVRLFVQKRHHEIQRPIRVTPEGDIFQMSLHDGYLVVRKYELQKTPKASRGPGR